MKTRRFAIVVIILSIFHLSSSNRIITENFLMDFFRNKQVSIVLDSCWDRERVGKFVKFTNQSPLKRIAVFNGKTLIFDRLKHDVYYVGDLINCPTTRANFRQFLVQRNVFGLKKFLLTATSWEFSEFSKISNEFPIDIDVEFIIAIINNNGSIQLFRPYKIRKINNIIWNYYGNWSVNGLFINNQTITKERMNLKQTKFVVGLTILHNDTFQQLHAFKDVHIDSFAKLAYGCVHHIFQIHNATFTLATNPSFGYYNETTGRINGLLRMIADGQIDIAGCFYMYESRYRFIDFLHTGLVYEMRFLVHKPSTSSMKNIFVLSFTNGVWWALLLVLLIFAIFVRIILNFETRSNRIPMVYSASDVGLIALEALCQQGTTTEPARLSGRIIVLIFFAAFMFVYVSYSANIVVLLQSTTPLDNLEELLNSRIEVAGENAEYARNYFQAPQKGVLRELYTRKIYPDRYLDLETGMRTIQERTFAYHTNLYPAFVYILYNFTNYEICALQQLPGYNEVNSAYVGIAKNSPFNEMFKISLLRVDEYGLRYRVVSRIFRQPTCHSHSSSFKSIDIYDCRQIFWIWTMGVGLTISILIIELIAQKLTRTVKIFKHNH